MDGSLHRKSPQGEHPRFIPSVYSRTVARKARDTQDSLPFEDIESDTPRSSDPSSPDVESGARRPGRPRVWASEAERKRAYRERLAADFAEPDRLRKELRAERKHSAEKDREIARLQRELARIEAENERRTTREGALEGTVRRLEAKVDDWRSRATALAKNLEAERAASSAVPPTLATNRTRPVPPTKRTTPRKPKRRKR